MAQTPSHPKQRRHPDSTPYPKKVAGFEPPFSAGFPITPSRLFSLFCLAFLRSRRIDPDYASRYADDIGDSSLSARDWAFLGWECFC